MFLGSNFVGGEVTGYLRIVECGGKSESAKNKGEEREREKRTRFFAPTPYLPHPSLFFFLTSLCTVLQSEYLEQAGTFAM